MPQAVIIFDCEGYTSYKSYGQNYISGGMITRDRGIYLNLQEAPSLLCAEITENGFVVYSGISFSSDFCEIAIGLHYYIAFK